MTFNVIIKTIQELTDEELQQLNEASKREFLVSLPPRKILESGNRKYFLILNDKNVLAMGQLLPVEPILFNNEEFYISGIGGIIANEKGKGYGRQIMVSIRNELISQDKTGVGFCKLKNKGFYEKCGFKTNTSSLVRFIYRGENPMTADVENECIFYQDGSDNFMEKVIEAPNLEVALPFPPTW